MMLIDGQLSHIGFEARCRLLSVLFAVEDEAGEEAMEQRGQGCDKTGKGEDVEEDKDALVVT